MPHISKLNILIIFVSSHRIYFLLNHLVVHIKVWFSCILCIKVWFSGIVYIKVWFSCILCIKVWFSCILCIKVWFSCILYIKVWFSCILYNECKEIYLQYLQFLSGENLLIESGNKPNNGGTGFSSAHPSDFETAEPN